MASQSQIILIFANVLLLNIDFATPEDTSFRDDTGKSFHDTEYHYETKTIKLPVDHFSFALNDTFDLRYLINDTWQRGPNPTILFYTGNEGYIETFAENTGFMWELAPILNATLIFAEHRYYGHSIPYANKSQTLSADGQNLGYLTSRQALADFAHLVTYLKNQPATKNSPVIVFGGSYGGMLSAWMRMKYPHLVEGAIAASAPILQFTDVTSCEAFTRITSAVFGSHGKSCPDLIRKSWSAITKIGSEANGTDWIWKNWKLCRDPSKNATALKEYLNEVYGNLAMINYPYENDFLAPVPANPVAAFCSHLTNATLEGKDLLLALNKALSVYTNYTGKTECVDIGEGASPSLGASGWDYQACTEMVMPMCSDGVHDMFEPIPWDLKKFSEDCHARYGVTSDPYVVCEEYGCRDLSTASNIVFSNGLLDPWSGGGVLRNLSSSTIAVIIPEGAHHIDLRASNPNDPRSVVEARKVHKRFIVRWIKDYHRRINRRRTSAIGLQSFLTSRR